MTDSLSPKSFFGAFDIAFFMPGTVLFLGILVCVLPAESELASTEPTPNVIGPAATKPLASSPGTIGTSDATVPRSLILFQFQTVAAERDVDGEGSSKDSSERKPLSREQFLDALFRLEGSVISAASFAQLAICVVAIYVLGLSAHGTAWLVFHPFEVRFDELCDRSRNWRLVVLICGRPQQAGTDEDWTSDADYMLKFADYFWYLRSTCWNTGAALIAVTAIWYLNSYGNALGLSRYLLAVGCVLLPLGFVFGRSCRKARRRIRSMRPASLPVPTVQS